MKRIILIIFNCIALIFTLMLMVIVFTILLRNEAITTPKILINLMSFIVCFTPVFDFVTIILNMVLSRRGEKKK